jgi:raffinose/stachyose/melibiose transport system substrate-binding protein
MRWPLLLPPLLAISLLVALTGCSKPVEPPSPTPAATEPGGGEGATATQPLKGKLTLWTIWNAEPRKSALEAIVAGFEKANPDVQVEISNNEPDAYKTKIKVALGGPEPPDIYFVWSGEKMLHSFVRGGNCLDLTPYLDANKGEWRNKIVDASLQPYVYDNKTWGVPYLLQCTFFFYNKDLFARHNLQIPKTWDELIDVCKKLKAAGITPLALGNLKRWPAHHFPCVLFQRLMGNQAVMAQYDPLGPGDYSDPNWVKGIEMFDEFQKQGFFNPSPNGVDRDDARMMFYTEKTAMFYTGTWDFSQFSDTGPAPSSFWAKWDFFNFPAVPGGKGEQDALAGSPDGYVISSKTRNPEAAVAFLKYMTSPEVAHEFVTKCKELVQVKGAVTDDNASWYLRKYAKIVEEAKVISPWTDTVMELSVAETLMDGVQALLAGTKKPDQIMDEVRKRQAQVKKELQAASTVPVKPAK